MRDLHDAQPPPPPVSKMSLHGGHPPSIDFEIARKEQTLMSIGDMQFRKSCRRPLDCFGKDTARPYGVAARWTRQHTERNVVPLGSTAAEVLDVAIPQVDSPTSFGLGARLQAVSLEG